jgi:hypothetical protein
MIQSHEIPQEMVEINGKRKYRINVQEVTKEGMEGTELYYTYDEIEFSAAIPVEITDAKVAKLELQTSRDNAYTAKAEALKRLTVTTESGKVFYADTEARIDLQSAIEASNLWGSTETMWKLAEEFEGQKIVLVTIDEIREASNKALEAKGNIVGVVE